MESNTPEPTKDVAIVVTCKGRLDYLKDTLPKMCSQDTRDTFTYRVVLVDYGCPDGTFEYFHRNPLPNLRVIKVEDKTDYFNLSRARNCGVMLADANIINFSDADTLVEPLWLYNITKPIRYDRAHVVNPVDWYCSKYGLGGTMYAAGEAIYSEGERATDISAINHIKDVLMSGKCAMAMTMTAFLAVRGYDELMEGWGWEDNDMYVRLNQLYIIHQIEGHPLISSMNHHEELRTEHYKEKNRHRSHEINMQIANNRRGFPNPSGIGVCEYRIYDCDEIHAT
jgi:hypothetical protein